MLPEDVDAIVFWTKNPRPLMRHLDLLEVRGIFYTFQFTITGYSNLLEPLVGELAESVESLKRLSDRIGPDRVTWRFDPIFICDNLATEDILVNFQNIAGQVEGYTRKVVISFLTFYEKIKKRASLYGIKALPESEIFKIAAALSGIAGQCGIEIESCAQPWPLDRFGIKPARCIDAAFIGAVSNRILQRQKDPGQRAECGCSKSVDIGSYNTCPHGCVYCYANHSPESVKRNFALHDPDAEILIGKTGEVG